MSNVGCKRDLFIDSEASASQSSRPSQPHQYYQGSIPHSTCDSESPPSYTLHPAATAAAAALGLVAEHPVVVPQQRPFTAAPFFSAYAPTLRNHGIPPGVWHNFVASMNEAVSTVPSVSAKARAHARSFNRRIRSASEGMWTALGSWSSHSNHHGSATSGRNSPLHRASSRTLREERILTTLAAANIAWFHPRGLHVAMMDTIVLAGRLVVNGGGGDRRGILPSRLIEAARPRRDEGPAAQLAGLRPWVAELEVDSAVAADPSKILDLAPDSLWLVVTCRSTGGGVAAGS